ncbi:IS1 family transposase [Candidatus Woesearchaeota archaeon]|nr:IS1 family transposase [Candidatus Woesearchaeota archaeon]
MARPKTHNKAVCQNPECSFFRKENGKDITKQGKNYAGHQRFLCKHCSVVFVETKGTPLYQKKLSERKIKAICKELVEKKGIRAVERTLNVHRDTVGNLLKDLAEHALSMTNYMVHDLKLSAYEVDELWTFVKKNKKNLSETTMNSLSAMKPLSRRA